MITLSTMTEADFQAYLEMVVPEYAAEKVAAGNWPAQSSLRLSRQEYQRLLPQGIFTPHNILANLINESSDQVGWLWYCQLVDRPATAFIYDFGIYEAFRRRGYATQALAALETRARSEGIKRLELHVFGTNASARALYTKAGFFETNVNMAKEL